MQVIDWLKRRMTEKAQDLLMAPLGEKQGAPALKSVETDTDYVTIRVKAARIVDVRRWNSKFYGCIHSRATLLHEASGSMEHQTVLAPSFLKELDPANLDRVVQIDKVLLGPFPYRGRLDLTIGLFSVKAADLAAPYIDLLTSLADTAGVAYLAAAKPFIEPLRKGADLLFGNANTSELEVGYDQDFTTLKAGYYLAMRAPKNAVPLDRLRIDPSDFRLLDERGQPFGDYPYVVFSIEATTQRQDWMLIPDLKNTWDGLKQAFVAGNHNEAEQLLGQFERQSRVSPDLVFTDARRLAERARSMFGATQTQVFSMPSRPGMPTPAEFPELRDLGLYG